MSEAGANGLYEGLAGAFARGLFQLGIQFSNREGGCLHGGDSSAISAITDGRLASLQHRLPGVSTIIGMSVHVGLRRRRRGDGQGRGLASSIEHVSIAADGSLILVSRAPNELTVAERAENPCAASLRARRRWRD